MSVLPENVTLKQIADQAGAELHKVQYVIKSRGIKPARRVGNTQLFSPEAAGIIHDELVKIRAKRKQPESLGV